MKALVNRGRTGTGLLDADAAFANAGCSLFLELVDGPV